MKTVSASLLWDDDYIFKGLLIDRKMLWIADGFLHIYNPYTGQVKNHIDINFDATELDTDKLEEYLNYRLSALGISSVEIVRYYPKSSIGSGWLELTFKVSADVEIQPVESVPLYSSICNRIIPSSSVGTYYYIAYAKDQEILPIQIVNRFPHILNRALAESVGIYYTFGKGVNLSNGETAYFPASVITYNNSEIYVVPSLYVSDIMLQLKIGGAFKWIKIC